MSILNAFNNLNRSLLESASTDEFKQLLAEITEIEDEIKDLQKEVSDGWTRDYARQLDTAMAEIRRVRKDLYEIIRSYEIEYLRGYAAKS